jgi:hypothetical protein
MRANLQVPFSEPTEIHRTDVQTAEPGEQLFASVMAEIAGKLWPDNTAAHLAAAAHCGVRAAEYYLAGGRKWSGDAIAAIVSEILRRHAMRHVKVAAR